MTNTQPPVTGNTPQPTITPEVGKRYVTRGGWVTPPLQLHTDYDYPFMTACGWTFTSDGYLRKDKMDDEFDLIAEYVEPTPETLRRDLIARLYCAMVTKEYDIAQGLPYGCMAHEAILAADTLIKAMEGEV